MKTTHHFGFCLDIFNTLIINCYTWLLLVITLRILHRSVNRMRRMSNGVEGLYCHPRGIFNALRFLFHSSGDLMKFSIMIYSSINFILDASRRTFLLLMRNKSRFKSFCALQMKVVMF